MPSKEFRTHCKKCGQHITDSTQRVTCADCRRTMTSREMATCPCGQPAENIRSKYCGPICRKKWGVRPPVRMVTHTCLGCGEPFERPHYYPGKKKYCSVRCQHREQKKTTDVGALLNDKGTLIFRSTWEIRFYAACLRFDIPIRSYDGPDIETSAGVYRPDFIIYDDVVIDVKGYLRPENEAKYREAGVRLVGHEELRVFEQTAELDLRSSNR